MKNKRHLKRLIEMMAEINDFPALDDYGSKIFGHPVYQTWKLFRHIAKTATADIWVWSSSKETASYPKSEAVPTLEDFATVMLHEVAHGWCYFYKNDVRQEDYPTGACEERVCWDVSRLVCDMLGITYQTDLEVLAFRAYILSKTREVEEFQQVVEQMPAHLKW